MEQNDFAILSTIADEALIIGGADLAPSYIVTRVECEDLLIDTAMNPVELGVAVEVAHQQQAEQLG